MEYEMFRDVLDKLVEAGILKEHEFDTALPQAWWDEFYDLMGEPPSGFVWNYPEKSIWGEPFAVTPKAKKLFAEYNHRVNVRKIANG